MSDRAGPSDAKLAVVSFFGENVPAEVPRLQREVVLRFLKTGSFYQFMSNGDHGENLDTFLDRYPDYGTVVFLDIDCIPLNSEALPRIVRLAREGHLVGCAQRAGHIHNGEHVYAGPCAMAFTRDVWIRAGRPSMKATRRGDVGEEMTYCCEAAGIPVMLLWPSHVEEKRWELTKIRSFGLGTTYEGDFYHQFEARVGCDRFIKRCKEVLGYAG